MTALLALLYPSISIIINSGSSSTVNQTSIARSFSLYLVAYIAYTASVEIFISGIIPLYYFIKLLAIGWLVFFDGWSGTVLPTLEPWFFTLANSDRLAPFKTSNLKPKPE